jgi:predicted DNA-binding WGR domain protein
MSSEEQCASLFFREGTHDKIYTASIQTAAAGYVVNYTYGRRSTRLQSGSKTPAPVKREEALRIFNSLVAEKIAKGYQPDQQGPAIDPMVQTREGRRFTRGYASALQSKLWSGNYMNSWGTQEEFRIIISEHPELLDMTLDEAADAVMKNLAAWAPAVAAKELKARGRSQEEREIVRRRTQSLLAAIKTREVVGPASANVSVATFDLEKLPEMKKDFWVVMTRDHFLAFYPDRETAMTRALEVVDKGKFVGKLSVSEVETPRGFRVEVRGTIAPRDEPEAGAAWV